MTHYIIYNSITHATRIKRLFIGDGSTISLTHAPKSLPVNGCAYALVAQENKVIEIIDMSKKCRIKIKGVFKKDENGEFSEVNV